MLALRRPATLPPRPDEPWLWVIAAGRPDAALRALGFEGELDWPAGFYGTLQAFRMRLIVTSELPSTPETLVLRALGSGKTLRAALRELRELGLGHPVSRIIRPILLRLHFEQREVLDPLDQEFQMETHDFVREWEEKVKNEGRLEGEARGEARALLRVLTKRKLSVSAEQEARILGCADVAVLEGWLDRALTAESTEDVLR